ncbi:MAG TPA: ABC transporter permease [Candidatus Angelobacter sp.]|nr:ABC transporter permease [Candidatus Angelobacter sp.]
MRNIFLIARREYLERIRSKSFLIMTFLIPFLMATVTLGPGMLTVMLSKPSAKHFVVVTSRAEVGEAIRDQLSMSQAEHSKNADAAGKSSLRRREPVPPSKAVTDIDTNTSPEERAALTAKVSRKEIDGVIWATDDAIARNRLDYITRDVSGFIQTSILQEGISEALHREALKAKGLNQQEVDSIFQHVTLEAVAPDRGGPGAPDPQVRVIASFVMVMILYMSLLLYGINVMRSVLEEKTSRIMEVMLSVAQPKEMMAGKILGVGAVGLTQFAIWITATSIIMGAQLFAVRVQLKGILTPGLLASFAIFFLLGYTLYSTLYAAIGAMVNSEQEAQQTQFVVLMPIIAAIAMAFPVLTNPETPIAFWGSMIPFTAPIVMFIRMAVQPPPPWQIGLSVALILATIYGLVLLCGRIYRVGILMYGKKPTLPEILKWLKYS